MNFYKHHIGDYAQATAHLSFAEDAAYSRLLRKYYAEEAPIPAELKVAQRLVGARTREEKDAVETVLEEFFELQDDGWHNKRADEEIAAAHAQDEDREARRSNEAERQRRHRERRRELFDILREHGEVPKFDTKTEALEAMVSRVTGADRTRDSNVTEPDPSRVTGGVRHAPATANQKPEARSQYQEQEQYTAPIDPEARAPALVGTFEGHPDPRPAPPNPAAPLAIALNRAGFRCTSANPDLVAYAAEGGTPEHLAEIAAHPDCAGKAATYVLRFARRELTQPAAPIATGPPRNGRAPHDGPSKTLQGIQSLEAMKPDEHQQQHEPTEPQQRRLADDRGAHGVAEAADALARSITRR